MNCTTSSKPPCECHSCQRSRRVDAAIEALFNSKVFQSNNPVIHELVECIDLLRFNLFNAETEIQVLKQKLDAPPKQAHNADSGPA